MEILIKFLDKISSLSTIIILPLLLTTLFLIYGSQHLQNGFQTLEKQLPADALLRKIPQKASTRSPTSVRSYRPGVCINFQNNFFSKNVWTIVCLYYTPFYCSSSYLLFDVFLMAPIFLFSRY